MHAARIEAITRAYRQDGFVHLPAAIPDKLVPMLKTIYQKAVDARNGSSYPNINFSGPLTQLYAGAPNYTGSDKNKLIEDTKAVQIHGEQKRNIGQASMESASEPQEKAKRFNIKVKSDKHREKIVSKLQEHFGSRFMPEEKFKEIFGSKDWLNNPHFIDYIKERYYHGENHAFVESIATNKLNVFQSFPDIKESVLLADPEIIPFSLAAQCAGCISLRLWCENYFTKEKFSNAYPLHCTLPFVALANTRGEPEMRGCTLWVLLEDIPVESGGLCLLKGSHRVMNEHFKLLKDAVASKHPPMSFEFDWWYRQFIKPIDEKNGTQTEVARPALKRGDMLLVNHSTLHGIAANPIAQSWSALQYTLIPDGSIFAGFKGTWAPRTYLKNAEPGDIVDDADNFPTVYNAF